MSTTITILQNWTTWDVHWTTWDVHWTTWDVHWTTWDVHWTTCDVHWTAWDVHWTMWGVYRIAAGFIFLNRYSPLYSSSRFNVACSFLDLFPHLEFQKRAIYKSIKANHKDIGSMYSLRSSPVQRSNHDNEGGSSRKERSWVRYRKCQQVTSILGFPAFIIYLNYRRDPLIYGILFRLKSCQNNCDSLS